MNESDVSRKLREALVSKGALMWKYSDRFHASRPDLIGCFNSRFIAIETKIAPNKPTKLQQLTLQALEDKHAWVYVVTYDKKSKELTVATLHSGWSCTFLKYEEAAEWILKQRY